MEIIIFLIGMFCIMGSYFIIGDIVESTYRKYKKYQREKHNDKNSNKISKSRDLIKK